MLRPPRTGFLLSASLSLSLSASFGFALLLWLGLIGLSSASTATNTVRIFLEENFDAQGKTMAESSRQKELWKFLEKETGLRFELVRLPWRRAQIETLAGKGLIYGFSKTSERLSNYDFSEPVVTENIWAITTTASRQQIKSVDDLRDKKISIGYGISYGTEFQNARKTLFQVQEENDSSIGRLRKLVLKKNDVLLWGTGGYDKPAQVDEFVQEISAKDPELKQQQFTVSEIPVFYDSVHFAAAKNHYREVLRKIDAAISLAKKNGSLSKIPPVNH